MRTKLLTYLLSFSALILAISSCQKQEELTGEGLPTDVTISVAAPAGYQVKSDANPGDGTLVNRCILEVYESGVLVGSRQVADFVSLSASFNARLVTGREYQFVFWADNATGDATNGFTDLYYNTSNLNAISVITTDYANNTDARDAFFYQGTATVTAGNPLNFTLTRPFGQVRVLTTDLATAGVDATNVTVKASFANVPSTFNALTGETSGTTSYAPANFIVPFDLTTGTQFTYDYIFAPSANQALVELTVDVQVSGADHSTTNGHNIPVERNRRTNVSGNFLTSGSDITVTIDPGFNGDINPSSEQITTGVTLNSFSVSHDDVQGSTVNYTIDVEEGVSVTASGVAYRVAQTTDLYTEVPASAVTRAAFEYTATLTGLTAETEYEYYLYFTVDGTNHNSTSKTFTTPAAGTTPDDPVQGPKAVTIEDFLAAEVSTSVWYQLTGAITSIRNASFGNIDIEDATGTVYIHGLTETKQETNDNSFSNLNLKVGDTVTLVTLRAEYNSSAQGGGTPPAYYVSHVAAPVITGDPTALLITEYVEGSSNNKYIELTNISSNEINLAAYTLRKYTNGTDKYDDSPLSGMLAAGASVVYSNSSAALTLPEGVTAQTLSGKALNFNGNDAVVVVCNGVEVDIVGDATSTANWGADITLARKEGKTPTMTYNTDDWDQLEKDDVTGLGKYPNTTAVTPVAQTIWTIGGEYYGKVSTTNAKYLLKCQTNMGTLNLTLFSDDANAEGTLLPVETAYTFTSTEDQANTFTAAISSYGQPLSVTAASFKSLTYSEGRYDFVLEATIDGTLYEFTYSGSISFNDLTVIYLTSWTAAGEYFGTNSTTNHKYTLTIEDITGYIVKLNFFGDAWDNASQKLPVAAYTFNATDDTQYTFNGTVSNANQGITDEPFTAAEFTSPLSVGSNYDINIKFTAGGVDYSLGFFGQITLTDSRTNTGEGGNEGGEGGTTEAPKVGDYYYSDGTWSTTLDASKTPIAVVFWVGNAATEDAKLAADFPDKTFQGLAVALNNVPTSWSSSNDNIYDWATAENGVDWTTSLKVTYPTWGNKCEIESLYGYANTAALKAWYTANSSATFNILDELAKLEAPTTSSGWYIPSGGELIRLWTTQDIAAISNGWSNGANEVQTIVDGVLGTISGANTIKPASGTILTWCSNERSEYSNEAYRQSSYNGAFGSTGKNNTNSGNMVLRAVLAF